MKGETSIRRPRLKDIAEISGVSTTTVSQILKGRGSFSPATVERILAVAQELNYPIRRKREKKWTFELAVPELDNPFYVTIIKFVEGLLRQRGFILSLIVGRYTAEILGNLCKEEDKGLFLCPPFDFDEVACNFDFARMKPPLVLINGRTKRPDISYVVVDNLGSAKEVVSYLLEKGRRRIVYLRGKPDKERFEGYLLALKERGLEVFEDLIVESGYTYHGGYSSVIKLIEKGIRFDAIFACNDLAAFGAIEALRIRGLKVPHDVSVVGFDDIWFSQIYTPKLTTVRQPLYDMCHLAVDVMLNIMAGKDRIEQRVFQAQFVIRESA